MRLSAALFSSVALTTAVGCAAPVLEEGSEATGSVTRASILIERATTEDELSRTNVSAKFMRAATSLDAEAAETLIGSRLVLPPLNTCSELKDGTVALPVADPSEVELLFAGDLTLTTPESTMRLSIRAFPDIADVVSGVLYTSEDATTELPLPGQVVLEASGSGSSGIDAFVIRADGPEPPTNVRINGRALGDQVTLRMGQENPIEWAASQGSQDLLYVDLIHPNLPTTRCSFSDSGKAVLSLATHGPQGLVEPEAQFTLVFHRLRASEFAIAGIDQTAVRFDASTQTAATIEIR